MWASLTVLSVLLVLYAMFSLQIFYANSINDRMGTLEAQALAFDEQNHSVDRAGAKELSDLLGGSRITFIALDGEVLGDSQKEELENHKNREEVREAIENGEGTSVRKSDSFGDDTLYYCKKISVNGEEILLRIAVPSPSIWETFGEILPTLVWFMVLIVLICLLFAFLATDYVLQPVQKIAKDAALNLPVHTTYPELQPVVDILNKRNQEVTQKIRELSEEKELVDKAQRSKNDFIANVTHEMNTPLTSIKGYSELLASGTLDGKQTAQAGEILLTQSDRLSKLVKWIINYNEIDNDDLPLYEVNASNVVNELLDVLAPEIAKRGVTLEKRVEEDILLLTRYERLHEVFGNLIRNAVRYNKENGGLTVSLERTQKGVRFTVSDTGIGIAEEDLERVFDRFFTVDKSHNGEHGGFGLGLATVKKICKRSGWVIGVKSELGKGTVFTVDF